MKQCIFEYNWCIVRLSASNPIVQLVESDLLSIAWKQWPGDVKRTVTPDVHVCKASSSSRRVVCIGIFRLRCISVLLVILRDVVKIQLLCSVAYDVLVITCRSLVVATQLTLEAHVWSLCDA